MTGPEPVSDPDALVPFIEGTTGSVFNIIEVDDRDNIENIRSMINEASS